MKRARARRARSTSSSQYGELPTVLRPDRHERAHLTSFKPKSFHVSSSFPPVAPSSVAKTEPSSSSSRQSLVSRARATPARLARPVPRTVRLLRVVHRRHHLRVQLHRCARDRHSHARLVPSSSRARASRRPSRPVARRARLDAPSSGSASFAHASSTTSITRQSARVAPSSIVVVVVAVVVVVVVVVVVCRARFEFESRRPFLGVAKSRNEVTFYRS